MNHLPNAKIVKRRKRQKKNINSIIKVTLQHVLSGCKDQEGCIIFKYAQSTF